ncbi:T9SS type B sorting domain-containing protein [Portibacter lacus]|uniref:P/Homo B domain-containing protein n=1 Tax=Portibacter lacus TaxID=1099794 RepID=A0AA37SMI1_9BACT|nr:gliding motility-associated C-terminal domain-containing protein [Portibacter lacus]GLR16102.1 hypothetical protein GCM10007940_07170 [Portibacter lacus]
MNICCKTLFALLFYFTALSLHAQCANVFGSFDIPDNTDTCLVVNVSGVINDDLSLGTILSGLEIEFEHDALSDLLMILTSPSGQEITLIGDLDQNGSLTPGANWNILFTECLGGAIPHSGTSEIWDNSEFNQIGGNYTGIYYPSDGCFEDFNVGSVNGDWTLCIIDGFEFNTGHISRIGFILNGNATCVSNTCNAEAGTQDISDIEVCLNDDLNLDLGLNGEINDPEYTIAYLISQNDVLTSINLDGNFIGIDAGIYDICAVSVNNDDLLSFINSPLTYTELITGITLGNLPFCIDLTDNCTTVEFIEAPAVRVMDEVICNGEEVIIGGEVFNTEGTFSATAPRMAGDLCDTTVVLNLEIIGIQPIIQASAPELNCNTTTITLDASGSIEENGSTFLWTTTDGLITSDPTQLTIDISQPGTYFLEQSENGCQLSTSINITLDAAVPQFTISAPPLSCVDESVLLSVNSSANIVSAIWTGPFEFTSTTIEPTVSHAGRYTALLTDDAGCQVMGFYDLEQGPDQPTIEATAPNISCTVSSVQISVSDNSYSIYRWTGPLGFVSNIAEPMVTIPGEYFLEVHNADGCKGYTSLVVIGDVGIFDYEVTGEDFLCNGGVVTISASSEASNAIYSWTGPNNFFSSSATNSVASEGTYYVEIFANGCYVRDSVTLIRDISDLPDYNVMVENIGDCENPLWRLTAIPLANEFQTSLVRWGLTGVAVLGTGNQIDVNTAGNYFLLINTFNGCSVVYRFTIDPINGTPTFNIIQKTNVSCTTGPNSGVIGITQNPDYAYNWTSDGGFTADTSYIANLAPGFYYLTITDINTGCVSLYSDRIIADTIPRTSSISNTEINCINPEANIFLTANGGGNTYAWSGPNNSSFTTKNLSISEPGQYMVTITGGNGCITLDTATVIQDTDPPVFSLADTSLECETQSATLNANVTDPGVIYQWEGPNDYSSSIASPVVFGTGQYNLTLTGQNGCISNTSILVSPNPDTPIPSISALDTLTCADTLVSISAEANVPIASYLWDGPGLFTSDLQNPMVSEPGEYIVTIESQEGCIAFDTIEVIQELILPEVTYSFDGSVECIDIESQLKGITTDPGATFLWTGPNGFSSTDQNTVALDTGEYIYTIRGSNNCVDSDTFNISSIDIDVINTSNLINCYNPNIDISELSDSLSYDIEWASPSGVVSNVEFLIPNETGIYTGIVRGSNGCNAQVEVDISYDTIKPFAMIQQAGTIRCDENIISLNANGSSTGNEYSYSWMTNDGIILNGIDSFVTQIQGIGNYDLIVTNNNNGCIRNTTYFAQEAPVEFIDITLESENPRCFGENNGSVKFIEGLGGTGPYTFSLDNLFYADDSLLNNLSPGEYTFFAKDSFGCIVEQMFTIFETTALELELGDNIDVFLGDETEISANTNLTMDQIESIRWQIENQIGCGDCLSFTLTPNEDLLVELTIIDEKGCTITDQVRVRVDQEPVLFKPNVFSPNDDGVNDIFYISSNPGVAQIKSILIFDRWGNKVHENFNFPPGDMSAGWDGKMNGQVLQPGVYVYKVIVEMITGDQRIVNGDVTILK